MYNASATRLYACKVLLSREHVNHKNGCQKQWAPEIKGLIKLVKLPVLTPLMAGTKFYFSLIAIFSAVRRYRHSIDTKFTFRHRCNGPKIVTLTSFNVIILFMVLNLHHDSFL